MQFEDGDLAKIKLKINPFVIVGILLGLLVIIFLIISLMQIFRTNQFGNETKIDNLTSEYGNLPQTEKDLIFNTLYGVIFNNLPDGKNPPESGAIIREGTAKYDYDEKTRVYEGDFIVDISSIEQSYRIHFRWSPEDGNRHIDGYPIVITCLPKRLQIYDSYSCKGAVEIDSFWENSYQLDYTFGAKTSARIRKTIGEFLISEFDDEDGYTILINASTLKKDKNQPDLTYYFEATLNQRYDFKVVVRMDDLYGDEYIAIYTKMDKEAKGFILTDSDVLMNELSDWLKSISRNNQLQIERVSLEGLE